MSRQTVITTASTRRSVRTNVSASSDFFNSAKKEYGDGTGYINTPFSNRSLFSSKTTLAGRLFESNQAQTAVASAAALGDPRVYVTYTDAMGKPIQNIVPGENGDEIMPNEKGQVVKINGKHLEVIAEVERRKKKKIARMMEMVGSSDEALSMMTGESIASLKNQLQAGRGGAELSAELSAVNGMPSSFRYYAPGSQTQLAAAAKLRLLLEEYAPFVDIVSSAKLEKDGGGYSKERVNNDGTEEIKAAAEKPSGGGGGGTD